MAVRKFGRNYWLSVQPNNLVNSDTTPIIIQPPFTLELDVSRGRLGSFNNATLRAYNLSPITRNRMLKDWNQFDTTRTMTLQAGYGVTNNLPLVFFGTLFECHSKREGTDYVTEIVGQAGGSTPNKYYQGNTTFAAGTETRQIIATLVQNLAALSNLSVGFIGQFPNKIETDYVPSNPLIDEINVLSGGCLSIDNGNINVYSQTEHLLNKDNTSPTPYLIDSSMGLLGTPTIEQKTMTIPILFEPTLMPGQQVNLQSTTVETAQNPYPILASYNGIQLVQNVHHSGIISQVTSGELKTDLTIVLGAPKA